MAVDSDDLPHTSGAQLLPTTFYVLIALRRPQDLQKSSHPQISTPAGKTVIKHSLMNLAGFGVPLVVAFLCIPLLIKAMGPDQFGILTLGWMFLGYFSIFDLGLSRALTREVSEGLSQGRKDIKSLIWSTLISTFVLGSLGGLLLAIGSPYLAHHLLKIPEGYETPTLHSFLIIAALIPFVISMTGLRGVLEAQQKFKYINSIQIISGVFNYALPLAIYSFYPSVEYAVATLALTRLLGFLAYLYSVAGSMEAMEGSLSFHLESVKKLLRYGVWITISNVLSPLMTYADRFLIGAIVSVAAVTYYVTPFDMITKIWILPTAITTVLFPIFSAQKTASNPINHKYFFRSTILLFSLLVPLSFLLIAFAHPLLSLWISEDFANESATALSIFSFGIVYNAAAFVPTSYIQAMNRPSWTAKLHIAEAVLYIGLLYWFTHTYGILGAAIAWAFRVLVDFLFLMLFAQWELKLAKKKWALIFVGPLVHISALFIWYYSYGTLTVDLNLRF